MSNRASTPFPIYNDKDGSPLDAGFIYFGPPNNNALATQIALFYDAELTKPAENPARTSNGYIVKNGAIRQLFCAEPIISIVVQNKRKETVWNAASINLNPGVTTDAVIDTATGDSQAEINADTLRISENLDDLGNKEEARANLSVYSKAEIDTKTGQATEENQGTVKVATEEIATALTSDTDIVTPKKAPFAVKASLAATGEAPVYACRAWVCFDGTNGTIKSSANVTSVTRNGVGDYTIAFTKEMPHVNYAWQASGKDIVSYGAVIIGMPSTGIKSKTQMQIKSVGLNNPLDPIELCVSIFC